VRPARRGKFDAQRDRSLWEAATREAEEEIGVPGAAVEVRSRRRRRRRVVAAAAEWPVCARAQWVGALPQSFPSSSSFLVAAFVGAIAPKVGAARERRVALRARLVAHRSPLPPRPPRSCGFLWTPTKSSG
jgi:8-oxo-dGTP pyrophosphatase MutT (NUDIX family)